MRIWIFRLPGRERRYIPAFLSVVSCSLGYHLDITYCPNMFSKVGIASFITDGTWTLKIMINIC